MSEVKVRFCFVCAEYMYTGRDGSILSVHSGLVIVSESEEVSCVIG